MGLLPLGGSCEGRRFLYTGKSLTGGDREELEREELEEEHSNREQSGERLAQRVCA